jgi:hypothetical protein
MNKINSLLFSALLGLLVLAGCGNNPQKQGPTETAKAFLGALQAGDYDHAKDFCTEGTKGSLSMFETFSGFGANPFAEEFQIIREDISEDYARVFYTQGDEDKEKFVRLKKEGNTWEVIANKADFSPKSDDKDDEEDKLDLLDMDSGSKEEVKEAQHDNKYKSMREGKTPEQIADGFLTAMMFGDFEKAKKLASKDSDMAITMQKDKGIATMEGFEIARSKEKGDYATVYYVETGETAEKELNLKKDTNGNWVVMMSKGDNPE